MSDDHAKEPCYCINSVVERHRKGQCLNNKIATGFTTIFGLPPPTDLQKVLEPVTAPANSPPQPRITFPASGTTQSQCRCTETMKFPHRKGKCLYTLEKKKKMAAIAAKVRKPAQKAPGGVTNISAPAASTTELSEQKESSAAVDGSDSIHTPHTVDLSTHVFPLLPFVSIPFTCPLLYGQPAPPPPPPSTGSPSAQSSTGGASKPMQIADASLTDPTAANPRDVPESAGDHPPLTPAHLTEHADSGSAGLAPTAPVADCGEDSRIHTVEGEPTEAAVPAPGTAPVPAPAPAPQQENAPAHPQAPAPATVQVPAPEAAPVPDARPPGPLIHVPAEPAPAPVPQLAAAHANHQRDHQPDHQQQVDDLLDDLMAGLMGEQQVPAEVEDSDEEDEDNDDLATLSGREVTAEVQRRMWRAAEEADDASVFTVRAL